MLKLTNIYKKTLYFKNKKIFLNIESKFVKNKHNIFFFGNPIYKNLDLLNENIIENKLKYINGYFLILIQSKKKITIYNDILGNFRLYYTLSKKGDVFLSNNFNYLIKINKIKILNNEEFNFWKSKNYTSGDDTFFKNLKKFPPASIFTFNFKGYNIKNIFHKQLINNSKNEIKSLDLSLKNSLNNLKNKNKKIILLFSGGIDSLLLAQKLKEINANFDCVYFKSKIKTWESEFGFYQSKKVAKVLNIKLKIIEIDEKINEKNFKKILECMLFDFHTSFVQFFGIKKILKLYGKNIEIVSGQSADSILCFGPSAMTLSNFLNRLLYIFNNIFINFIVQVALEVKYKTKLAFAKNNFEEYYFFYYGFFYYPLFNLKNKNTDKTITHKIKKIISSFKNKNRFLKMYLKIFGFLQGPDNQILIQSCLKNGFSNIFLPYSNKEIITSTCINQNKLKGLFIPKYEVKRLINSDLLKHNLSIKNNHIKYKRHKFLIPNIKRLYIKKINELKKQ